LGVSRLDQERGTARENPRLARSGARDHENLGRRVRYRCLLLTIEVT